MINALLAAQSALNSIRRTKLNGEHRDSYEVAALVDATIFNLQNVPEVK